MKAILYGWDRDASLMQLVHRRYMKLWPDCPFDWVVPMTDWNIEAHQYFWEQPKVEIITCESSAYLTSRAICDFIKDEEWVYWCICDRYPVAMQPFVSERLYHFMLSGGPPFSSISSVRLLSPPGKGNHDLRVFEVGGESFFLQRSGPHPGWWHHQFVRPAELARVLLSSELGEYENFLGIVPRMLGLLERNSLNEVVIPARRRDLIKLGEPMRDNVLTLNGYRDLELEGLPLPLVALGTKSVFFGGEFAGWQEP